MSYFNPKHDKSRELAKREIAAKIRGRKSVVLVENDIDGARQLIYSCLERMGTLLNGETQEKFYGIAIELIPTGSFNAQAFFPPKNPPFVLLDTGTIDFSGNMSALGMSLMANSSNSKGNSLSEQDIVDYIWASALIYYDTVGEWESSLEAIHVPKLNFSQIPQVLVPHALTLSVALVLFLVCHEIGHILRKEYPSVSSVSGFSFTKNLDNQFSESLADDFAFRLLIDYSVRWPDQDKVRYLLSGIDFGLTCIHLMQSAFPAWHGNMDGKKIIKVSESLDHPIALSRRESYRKIISSLGLNDFLDVAHKLDQLIHPYGELIRSGKKPSLNFTIIRELSKFF